MKLFRPILILASLASVYCFKVPQGQPDGVYSVYTDKNGTEIHKLIKLNPGPHNHMRDVDVHTRGLTPSAKFKPRQVPGPYGNSIGCGGYFLDVGNTNAANGALDAQCGDGALVRGGYDFYSIAGCTVAYFCNQSEMLAGNIWFWKETNCYAYERQAAADAINYYCGAFGAGWDNFIWDGGNSRKGQYGWENICDQGKHFCGRGV